MRKWSFLQHVRLNQSIEFHLVWVLNNNTLRKGAAPNHGEQDSATSFDAEGDTKFHGKMLKDLLLVEIFAGTARPSKIAREQGIGILPVDKTSTRASQVFIANCDVTNPEEFQALMSVFARNREGQTIGCPPGSGMWDSFESQGEKASELQKQRIQSTRTSALKRQAYGPGLFVRLRQDKNRSSQHGLLSNCSYHEVLHRTQRAVLFGKS